MQNLDLPSTRRQPIPEALHPTLFIRYHRQLRTLLLETQVWFCARDLSKLMGWPMNERTTTKLDPDQRRMLLLFDCGRTVDELMLSESGVYAMLIHHYHPENRSLRHWITNEVVPALRDAQHVPVESVPNLSLLQWSGFSLSMLQWQNEPWIRLRDVPQVLPQPQVGGDGVSGKAQSPWWAAASRIFHTS